VIAGTTAIELRDVTVRDGHELLLDKLDLSLDSGQSFALVGPHSRERSAPLRVVAGLCRPSAGQVRVGGWNAFERPERIRRLVGFVPEAPGLAERLTPLEHLNLVAAQRGLSRADGRVASESMLELVDLTDFTHAAALTLSRGQQRRLAMALALVHDPPIVLFDQPFDGVGEAGRGEIASVLLELRSMAKTLLIAANSPSDVADVCDVVAPIENGRLSRLSHSEPSSLVWIEVISDVEAALRVLREHPRVSNVRHDGGFITFEGMTGAEERSGFVEALLRVGIHLSGFGTTATPAGDAGG
jgi:ABC-2 type transport system ATP-binding protein